VKTAARILHLASGKQGRESPVDLPGDTMRIAIAVFVIVGVFLEPCWASIGAL
jgi:hypothetical protein